MSDTSEKPAKKGANMNANKMMMAMGFVLVLAIGAAVFFWNESRDSSNSEEAIAARNQEESDGVIANLDEVLLTESEAEPTVARVEDPQLLRDANPDFYKNVEEGDYLILYPQRAIIFRNTENRIINVAPIIDTSQLSTDGATQAPADDEADSDSDQ